MRTQAERWHDEAWRAEAAGNWPWVSVLVSHHHNTDHPRWLLTVNGRILDFETRRDALQYAAGLFLALTTEPEPNLDEVYSEPWDRNDKRSWTKWQRDHGALVDAAMERATEHISITTKRLDALDAAEAVENGSKA